MKSPDDAHFQQWAENPEPSIPSPDPQVILDCNRETVAYLYNTHNEREAWLTYHGEAEPLSR